MPSIASNEPTGPTALCDFPLPKLISGKLDVEDLDIDVGMTAEALEEATA